MAPACSRVRDAVDNLVRRVVLAELLLIDSLEVAWQALCLHCVHRGGTLLHALRGVGVLKAEVFECLAVCRRELEVGWDVATQFE